MSTSADDHEDQIYDSAIQCEIRFRKLLSALEGLDGSEQHRRVVRDSYHRFKLWAGSIGAFAERQVSLDTRLRFYLDVKNVVLRLLKLLETNLYHDFWFDPASLESHDAPTVLPGPSPTTPVQEATAPVPPSPLAAQAAVDAIRETIDRLQRLAIVIRRSSTSSLVSRVRAFALKADPVDLAEFEKISLLFVKGRLHDVGDPLARHLASSITFRRLRLLYDRRHQSKLEARRPARPSPPLPSEESGRPLDAPSFEKLALDLELPGLPTTRDTPHSGADNQSRSDPSTLNQSEFRRNYTTSAGTTDKNDDTSTVTSVAQGYSYPRPPKPPDKEAQSCRCDWCYDKIEVSKLEDVVWWRSHFKKDLQPYVCISEECAGQSIYFKSFSTWRKHMEDVHTSEWARKVYKPNVWYCDDDSHAYYEFANADKLREHLDSKHSGAYTVEQLDRKLSRNVMPSPRKQNICPLCNQDILAIYAQQEQLVGQDRKGKEKEQRPGPKKKTRFQGFDEISSSDEESLPESTSPTQAPEEMSLTNREKISRHIGGHLKSFAFLSIRYLDEESTSGNSEQTSFGIVEERSDEERLVDDFPEAEGLPDFDDIPRDQRPAEVEEEVTRATLAAQRELEQTNEGRPPGDGVGEGQTSGTTTAETTKKERLEDGSVSPIPTTDLHTDHEEFDYSVTDIGPPKNKMEWEESRSMKELIAEILGCCRSLAQKEEIGRAEELVAAISNVTKTLLSMAGGDNQPGFSMTDEIATCLTKLESMLRQIADESVSTDTRSMENLRLDIEEELATLKGFVQLAETNAAASAVPDIEKIDSNNVIAAQDPWIRAYEIVQEREPDLMTDYKKHLASSQDDAALGADLSTPRFIESIVNKLCEDREKKQWRVSLLGKDVKTREQAERLVKFLLWSDPIVKNAVSAQPYAALAWSGVSVLLPLLTSGTTQNEAMLKGFNSIGDLQIYWQICEKYLQPEYRQYYQPLIEPLAKLYSYIMEYQARVICHLSRAQLSRAWQNIAGSNDWVRQIGEIDTLHNTCRGYIKHFITDEIREIWVSQLKAMQESPIILSEIREIVKEGRKQIQRNYEDQRERDLLHDLTSDYKGYKDFNPPRVQGTCEWFFVDDRFRKWRDSNTSSLLWVSAGPGCGKSVLSRALIDEGWLSTSVTTSTICYFFFKDGNESCMHSTDGLCAILHQLFTHNPTGNLIRHALPIHRKYGVKLRQNFSELWRILVECADSPNAGEIVCVLDALDECNTYDRRQLIDMLKLFYCRPQKSPSKLSSKLKFLITSRPYDDLEASFRKFSSTTTYMRFDGDDKSDQIGREIDLVIDAKVDDIAGGFTNEDRRRISDRLKSMQQRTYLWLHLTFDIIEQSPSKYGRLYDIESLLSSLPSQVSEAYENILGRSKNSTQTEILLQIVLASTRPLTLDEANIAFTLALRRQRFATHAALESEMWPREPRDRLKSIVKNLCGLFINVYDSELSFIHPTAREFLTHSEPQGNWKGRLSMPKSHSTISRSCLYYLSLKDFAAPIQSDSNGQKYPFLPYATANWHFHYISQEAAAADECRKHARILCNVAGPQAKLWITDYLQQRHIRVEGWTDLSLASYLGLTFVVDDILTQEAVDVNAQGGHYGNALQAASVEGHRDVVELLLGEGADVNAQGGAYDNALQAASYQGHKDIVELLLNKGADVQVLAKDEYTVGWVCALPSEMAAARGMLDEIHQDLQEQDPLDHNSYYLGQIHNHNVVVACLPAGIYGITPAATVAKDMLRTFRSIRFGLMVGIGGAAPSPAHDIRLGDVVVSQPYGTIGGVIQYDRGKTVHDGEFQRTGTLNSPPTVLLSALSRLKAEHEAGFSKIPLYLSEMVKRWPKMQKEYTYQGVSNDWLYKAEYEHAESNSTCKHCDRLQEVQRDPREDTEPQIHYGNIASGNQVIKHGVTRERLRKELDVLCFEMEAAGLMSEFPCLVIRGICDYSDSHKNKKWQRYAAVTAAAFAKELLSVVSTERVRQEKAIPSTRDT